MSKIDLENIKPNTNLVLLKINIHNDRIRFKSGEELWLDVSYSARHTSVSCRVVKCPDKIVFSHDNDYATSLEHDTTMEIIEGDEVFATYLSVCNAFEEPTANYFDVDGESYFFVRYDQLICAKRKWTKTDRDLFFSVNGVGNHTSLLAENNAIILDDEIYSIIPLNGNLLAEELDEVIHTNLIIPNSAKKKDKAVCVISFSGSCNKDYKDYPGVCDDPRIKNGMEVIVDKDVLGRFVEVPEHATLNGPKVYSIVERRLVHGFYAEKSNANNH